LWQFLNTTAYWNEEKNSGCNVDFTTMPNDLTITRLEYIAQDGKQEINAKQNQGKHAKNS
jgi:hypothetical protein